MKNRPLFLLIISLLISGFACNNPLKRAHSDILPLDSVAQIFADCLFLEGEIYVKAGAYDITDYSLKKYEDFFEQRGLTKELFVENARYYITHRKYATIFINKVDEIVEQRATDYRELIK